MALLQTIHHPVMAHAPQAQDLYRERAQDSDGNRYTVIVWRRQPELPITFYTLDDGTPVEYEDECFFRIVPTGKTLTRCDD